MTKYEVFAEWEVGPDLHDMHFELDHFGLACEKYLQWVEIVTKMIIMPSSTAKGLVLMRHLGSKDTFFKFTMNVS